MLKTLINTLSNLISKWWYRNASKLKKGETIWLNGKRMKIIKVNELIIEFEEMNGR